MDGPRTSRPAAAAASTAPESSVGVPNALWLYRTNITKFTQPARYFEFFDYGDGTTVALDLDSRDASGECALAETHAGLWAEYVEDVDGDFGSFLLALVQRVNE